MKRKCKNLCMLSRKGVKRIEEYWEPIESESGLDRLRVNRDTDAVCILLSKLPLDAFKQEEGYLGVEDTPTIKSVPKAKPSSQSASNGRKTPANKPKYHSHKAKQKPL
ncbi:RPP25L [Bugula neritina]|uniref:RPP25L n=1 Tax=Bugula neritina TaxID=10212 RepID=A0A7J7KCJ5_BUGNE|nr:RPP25L [Bugula neritina]